MEALATALASPAIRQALWLTAQVALAGVILHAAFGLALGYALARPGWRGRSLLDIVVTLPLVFPPMAIGFLLLMILGRRGPLGEPLLRLFGVELVFSVNGLILAAFVAGAFWGGLYLWRRDLPLVIVSHSFWSAFIFAVFPIR